MLNSSKQVGNQSGRMTTHAARVAAAIAARPATPTAEKGNVTSKWIPTAQFDEASVESVQVDGLVGRFLDRKAFRD